MSVKLLGHCCLGPIVAPLPGVALEATEGQMSGYTSIDGNCQVLEPNYAPHPDGISDYSTPYLFTASRLDILDNGSLKSTDEFSY